MPSIKDYRKHVIDDITSLLDTLDPSCESSKLYIDRFKTMNDKEFVEWMDWWVSDEKHERLTLFVEEFERNVDVDNIIKASELINVPLYEYVAMPDLNGSSEENVTCTPTPVPVGYIQPKRMPQTVDHKSTGSISDSKRNSKTGQVTGDDKAARNSDVESYAMISIGAENALKEIMGPRGDDSTENAQMKQQIATNGFFSLQDLESDRTKKPAINTLDTYFHLQGLMTNIVYPPDIIPSAEMDVEKKI